MNRETLRTCAYGVICIAGGAAALFLFVRYALPIVLPFLIAWGIALSVRPLAERIARRMHASSRVCRVLCTAFLLLFLLCIVGGFLWLAVGEAWRFAVGLGDGGELAAQLTALFHFPSRWLGGAVGETLSEQWTHALGNALSELLSGVLTFLSGVVGALPRGLLFLSVTAIASFYFSFDLERIHAALLCVLPRRAVSVLCRLKNGFFTVLLRYARSYLILMGITFVIVLVGFLLLGVRYSFLAALVVALLDMLPVIGVGTVLVPWSLSALLSGATARGVGLLLLFFFHELIRQLAEPKIVGRHLGIPPPVTLLFLYGGYALFGVLGILLLPVFTVLYRVLTGRGEGSSRRDAGKGATAAAKDPKE